ncbi:MAG: DNA polymerase III subunit delta [Planctomycetota bacterium]
MHVFDFLDSPTQLSGSVCPLFGGERFLQSLAIKQIKSLAGNENEFSISELDGAVCQWADTKDLLSTRSLFASNEEQIVIVNNADPFVKQHRERLEDRIKQNGSGCLILVVESWASNTKLYKAIDKSGIQIHCDAPIVKRGRSKQRDDARIIKWLTQLAKSKFEFKLSEVCAAALIELTECNFGRMDQELIKLSLYADEESELTPLEVRKIVGGWPTQTMWTAIDAALDGRAGQALDLLQQLFVAGEHPLAMFGQISWSLRRYAEVGEIVERDSRQRRKIQLGESLKAAGFKTWGNEMDQAGKRLKQLGRKRVRGLLDELVSVDFALKRTHSKEHRGRLMLELLFTKMSEQLSPTALSKTTA